jgi:site-specific DNA-methyltransferase (adenine-specific)
MNDNLSTEAPPAWTDDDTGAGAIVLGDNLEALPRLPGGCARLIYIDPPFNTGAEQKRSRLQTVADKDGDRTGFAGRRYRTTAQPSASYGDSFDDFLGFLMPRVKASLRCLAPDGSFFLHLDYREIHYAKVAMDGLLGRDRFMNEIIWAYDYGARQKNRWPTKHDTILWYAMDPGRHVFNYDEMDRIPYMAPGLVTREKAERGKTPTDVWWHTIVPTNGAEKTGYPTQKPLGILNRIVRVHSQPGDIVLDFFAGSGTTGESAGANGRRFLMVDNNAAAVQIMAARLARFQPRCVGFKPAFQPATTPC